MHLSWDWTVLNLNMIPLLEGTASSVLLYHAAASNSFCTASTVIVNHNEQSIVCTAPQFNLIYIKTFKKVQVEKKFSQIGQADWIKAKHWWFSPHTYRCLAHIFHWPTFDLELCYWLRMSSVFWSLFIYHIRPTLSPADYIWVKSGMHSTCRCHNWVGHRLGHNI